jgi:hypothetical protein
LTNSTPYGIIKKKKKGENQMIILEVMAGLTLLAISYVAEQLFDDLDEW